MPRSSRRLLLAALLLTLPSLAAAADRGEVVSPKLSYTGEAAATLDGGKNSGTAYAGQLMFGADVNLEAAFGWQGATIKAYGINRHGTNLAASSTGNSTSVQEIYGGQGTRLANLTLEQKLLDDRLVLEAGRSVANIHFLGSELCQYFQGNSACGNPTYVFRTSNFTWWPVSSWMADATTWLTPDVYLRVGAYQVDPSQAEDGQHGLKWSTHQATGWIVPYTIGWRSPASARLRARYELGGWQDNSTYRDPLRDINGMPAVLTGQDYANRHGRSGAFARFEQQLTGDGSGRGLTVFGAVLKGTSGQLIEDHFLQAGLVQKGTFARRPQDSIAFVVTQQKYSGIALENLRLARAAAGGSGTPHGSQVMMELSYGIQLTPQLRIAPNLHYIVHPDQFNEPARQRDLPDALIAGLRIDWSL
ncbi:carbohydrate porin [Stenotrophomonas maltophilia]|uniref:carbohydrate porin n=1 Tax=Stenotrophomonas maltophilia TaxID=40324 RepID=UPI002097AC93|nr:carbohydrate porin [Stenotrophomonas maltophilia]MCO7397706.1 carbohydrate porin [Stenotrophomonas maltophilia]MCO7409899.1 carbohydrate porin [Stenotrophomonas maltophilia]HDS1649657.1 carbohydrate porin [Stenotrophomonas maltophilia]